VTQQLVSELSIGAAGVISLLIFFISITILARVRLVLIVAALEAIF